MDVQHKIEIFTDGACSGNPGKGGYGILMLIRDKKYEKSFAKGFRRTTNNRMELLAVITALEKIKTKDNDIHIYTDSKYVTEAINQNWLYGWKKKDFIKVKNPDLWRRFYPLNEKLKPKFHWIKGHNGHPENEFCDQIAVQATNANRLEIDHGYETQNTNNQLF